MIVMLKLTTIMMMMRMMMIRMIEKIGMIKN